MSGVFFRGLTSATLTAYPSTDHVVVQQLLATASDGVRVQAKEIAEKGVATVAESDGFQAGKQAALLFVEQAIEEDNCGFEFIGRDFEVGRVNGQGNRLVTATSHDVVAAIGRLDRGIEELAIDFGPAETFPLHQVA